MKICSECVSFVPTVVIHRLLVLGVSASALVGNDYVQDHYLAFFTLALQWLIVAAMDRHERLSS